MQIGANWVMQLCIMYIMVRLLELVYYIFMLWLTSYVANQNQDQVVTLLTILIMLQLCIMVDYVLCVDCTVSVLVYF